MLFFFILGEAVHWSFRPIKLGYFDSLNVGRKSKEGLTVEEEEDVRQYN